MNALLQDLEVAYEVVSYPVESREEPEAPQNVETEETVVQESEVSKEEDFVVSELDTEEEPEHRVPVVPSVEVKAVEEVTLEQNETVGTIEDEEALEHAPDFELSSSFFDVEESQEEDGEAESIGEESEIQAVTSEEEAEFIFNEIEVKDHLEMEVVDPEPVQVVAVLPNLIVPAPENKLVHDVPVDPEPLDSDNANLISPPALK